MSVSPEPKDRFKSRQIRVFILQTLREMPKEHDRIKADFAAFAGRPLVPLYDTAKV